MVTTGGEQFDWEALVPRVIHPLKVRIIEGLRWVGEPLSASDLTKLVGEQEGPKPTKDDPAYALSHVSYHVVKLAEAGVIEQVRRRQVRGATEKFYFFP